MSMKAEYGDDEKVDDEEGIVSLEEANDHIRQLHRINRKLLQDNSRLFSRMEALERSHETLLVTINSITTTTKYM